MKNHILFLAVFIFSSCIRQNSNNLLAQKLGYNLDEPTELFAMPRTLKEISGIAMIGDTALLCVQDENGVVFSFSLKTKTINELLYFGPHGDYEDIALASNILFILESNGNIHEIKNLSTSAPEIKKHFTPLQKKNNAEALCYNPERDELLISCKRKTEGVNSDIKEIYAFDLKTHELQPNPRFIIKLEEIKSYLQQNKSINIYNNNLSKIKNINELLMPSAISIHPVTGELYILSAKRRTLTILDMKGNVKGLYPLENNFFMQAEGITFASNGDMYISNEGGKKIQGNILMFKYEK